MERTNEKWKANTATGFVRAEDKSPIAAVYGERDEVSGNFIPDDLMASRAILISAAPDLVEFVQQIFNGIDTGMITIDTPADETLANILLRGRKALSKATGAI